MNEYFENSLQQCEVTDEGVTVFDIGLRTKFFFPCGSLKEDSKMVFGQYKFHADPNIQTLFLPRKPDKARFQEAIKCFESANKNAPKCEAIKEPIEELQGLSDKEIVSRINAKRQELANAEKAPTIEYRKRCNVCGKVFCYTNKDVSDNINKGLVGALASIGTIANAIGGTMYGAYESDKLADRNKMRDFSKCPYCNSSNLSDITEEEFNQSSNENVSSQNIVSVADEIKKFKELLDMGAITQEEFDAKKKQLLGL